MGGQRLYDLTVLFEPAGAPRTTGRGAVLSRAARFHSFVWGCPYAAERPCGKWPHGPRPGAPGMRATRRVGFREFHLTTGDPAAGDGGAQGETDRGFRGLT